MQCEDLAHDLSGTLDGSARLGRQQRRHVDSCLRCQADVAQYSKMMRAMQALRSELVRPEPGLLGDILAGLDGESGDERHVVRSLLSGRRIAYLGGIAAATAAGAVSAIVFTRRARLVS